MTFNSWEFLLFYPVVLGLYFLLPRRAKWPMLLVASYFFYICYQPSLVVLILITTLISWLSAMAMARTKRPWARRLYLSLTLVVCLGVLFVYKYLGFFLEVAGGLVALLGGTPPQAVTGLLLPVGISFYTFQTLSYVIDVYRGEVEVERNFFFYALFVSFFPQLVAGPIERPDNLLPQLRQAHAPNAENALAGAKFMLLGFFKKVAVADLLSAPVTAVYGHAAEAGGAAVLLATLLFAVQIYCDFSGYTDIAIGCARIMGIRLMKNFDHPYRSTTVKEFWGRWHISLSSWLRDYLYFPLGGSRCSRLRHLFNLMVVFLVSGLWHGAALTYVVWGALHGLYRVVGELTLPYRDRLLARVGLSPEGRVVCGVRRGITFLLVCFAWIFFRAGSMGDALVLVERLFAAWSVSISDTLSFMGLSLVDVLTILLSIMLLVLLDRLLTYENVDRQEGPGRLLVQNGAYIYFVWVIIFAWVLLLSKGMSSTFIYFQF